MESNLFFFLVYFSIHCLGMFVLAVFGFRAFSDLSKFNELNKKHKWNISLVLIFGSYKSRPYPAQWQLHNSHPQQLSRNLQQPKSSQEGWPSVPPFCKHPQNTVLVFFISQVPLNMQKVISSSSSQPNRSMKPPQQQDKLQLWHISSQKQSSRGAPGPPWLIASSNICLLLIWIFTSFFMESQQVPLCPQQRQGPNFGHTLRRQ